MRHGLDEWNAKAKGDFSPAGGFTSGYKNELQ
jgi:hypothetical protein